MTAIVTTHDADRRPIQFARATDERGNEVYHVLRDGEVIGTWDKHRRHEALAAFSDLVPVRGRTPAPVGENYPPA